MAVMEERQSSEHSLHRPESSPSSSEQRSSSAPAPEFEEIQPSRQVTHHAEDGGHLHRHDSTAIIDEIERRELRRIATVISHRRRESVATLEGQAAAAAFPSTDPTLNPNSQSFDLGKWLQNFTEELQKQGFTFKDAGVAYKDLTVAGTGDALQLQSTVRSWLMAPLQLGEVFSFRKKETKTILHRFDGLLNSRELLIVLGRPGSGCSTLLKTMTGQLHGLHLGDKSVIHYNGIPQKNMIREFKGETTYNQEVWLVPHEPNDVDVTDRARDSRSTSIFPISPSARLSSSPLP